MRKNIRTALTLTLILLFVGCIKYSGGPYVSFRSVNNRIQGDWKIEDYSVDGIDYTQLIIDSLGDIVFFYVYDPGDGVGSNEIRFTAIPSVLTGVWFFNDNKREISIRFNDTHDSLFYENLELFVESQKSIWDIRKLSKKEFRIETTFENKDYKLILKR